MYLSDIINRKAIIENLQSTDIESAIEDLAEVVRKVYSPKGFKIKEVVKSVIKREKQGSTAKRGIAIPHAKIEGLESGVYVAIGRTLKGIDFFAPDGELVHTLFLIITSQNSDDNTKYLKVLARLAKLSLVDNFPNFIKQCKTAKNIYDLIVEMEEKLGEF